VTAMMIAPPGPPATGAAETRALFEQARRRRRRRRASTAAALALALAVLLAAGAWPGHHPRPAPAGRGPGAIPAPARTAPRRPLLAWVDATGALHLGSLAAGTQRIVTQTNAAPATPLVQAAGHLYWTDLAGAYVPSLGHWSQVVRELDLATGRTRVFQPGEGIFLSPSGRQLYLPQIDNQSLLSVPVAGPGVTRLLALPAGWYLPDGTGLAVAGGIVVQSQPELSLRHPPRLAVWDPRTGQVSVLGRAAGTSYGAVIGAYTAPGAGTSLLAWMPAACHGPSGCPVRITTTEARPGHNPSGRAWPSRTLRSPLPWGFALGGAFSPDGQQLAVFVNRGPGNGGGLVQLAIASTSSGALHLVPGARLRIGEDVAWVRWLPGGRQLIAGGVDRDVITTADGPARPFRFRRSPAGAVGYSAAVIPPGR
jgi:hypothetical protein